MKVGEHHVGSPIKRFVIGSLETFTFHGWMKQRIDFAHEMGDIVLSDVERIVLEQLIDTHEQIRDRMQPGKPGIFLEQVNEGFHRWNRPAEAFVGLLLGNDQGAVKSDEVFPNRAHDASSGIYGNKGGRSGGAHAFKCSRPMRIG